VITLRPVSRYAAELKPELPTRAFEPARSRLLWLPVHATVVAAGIVAIAGGRLPLLIVPLVSLVLGCSFAGLAFLAHETLHGAVVRNRALRYLVGFVSFLPFTLSPRLWIAWHNLAHHGNANDPDTDPDAYPTLEQHQGSWLVRVSTDFLGIGRGRLRGITSLSIGFTAHSTHQLFTAGRRGYLSRQKLVLARLETLVGLGAWAVVLAWVGPLAFVFAYVLPLLVGNAIVMGYIFTNHALSPHTRVNDPLANSLSVTVPRWVDFVTMRFGFHVEHHLFPWMSSRHAPLVRRLILARWPERYQSMPLWRALLAVHRTPRVYSDETTLIDPETGTRVPTLSSRIVSPHSRIRSTPPPRPQSPPRAA
jgi:fatty acid desaturase